jgi:ABC-type glutathione transport system ATPase component
MTAVSELDRLTKRSGAAARGIDGLSLSAAGGEVFGFLGPHGAGKTTTIRGEPAAASSLSCGSVSGRLSCDRRAVAGHEHGAALQLPGAAEVVAPRLGSAVPANRGGAHR